MSARRDSYAGRSAGTERLAIEGGTPVRATYLPFGIPAIGDDEIEAVVATLRSGWIGQGPKVVEFEEAFARTVSARNCVAVSSCTAGLHLALTALGIGAGDEVLVPALTFAASATAVEHTGAVPVFCDVEPHSMNISLEACRHRLTSRTRALLVVHFGGLPCDMEAAISFAREHELVVVEDAAHAVGATIDGRPVGSFPTLSVFSFYANKNITTGEGGMIALQDDELAERLRILRLHGLSSDAWRRYVDRTYRPSSLEMLGFKYNLTDLQASIGLQQLARFPVLQARREALFRQYDNVLGGVAAVELQARTLAGHDVQHGLHLYVLLVRPGALAVSRDDVVSALRAENIGAAIHYRALHLEPYYVRRFGHAPTAFPHAYDLSQRTFTLPLSPAMSDDDASDVLEAVAKVFRRYAA